MRYRITIKTAQGETRTSVSAKSADDAACSLSARGLMEQEATVVVTGDGRTHVYIPCRCQECGTVVMCYSLCPCMVHRKQEVTA